MSNKTEILKIKGVEIILENRDFGEGKIIINGTSQFSMFWGAMGSNIQDFLCQINSDYFANKLQGAERLEKFDCKKTFSEVRRFIREDINLKWYKHLEFQKYMRETLNEFESYCLNSYSPEHYFIENFFDNFVNELKFYLIENYFEREWLEKEFKGISEHWEFIQTSESEKTKYLKSLHKQIIRKLSKREVVLA